MEDGDDTPFNPKLYLQNPWWDPPEASEEVEAAIANFQATLTAKQRVYQIKSSKPNLTRLQLSALRALKNHDHLIVVEADKNMGVAIFDRDTFIKQVLDEHLGNAVTYQNITNSIQESTHDVGYLLNKFIENHGSKLPKKVITFMLRSFDTYGDKIAPFRATAKVHKNPVKLRPVVAKCGTAIEALSKWLDCEMQKLVGMVPWCIKDSDTFRAEVIELDLPPNSRLVTFDAVSMYSNIDLDHAMEVMQHWFETYVPGINGEPLSAPVGTLMCALKLVMTWNIMQFGDSFFKQLIGTAMGTSCAVFFANLYFGKHEKDTILPSFKDLLKRIPFYRRFVDDVFFVWIGGCDVMWDSLIHVFNSFGILKWDTSLPKSSVHFLDLWITMEGNRIVTKTYQKPNNPYLYLPPHSAHPSSMIHGTIYGLLRTYYRQNSHFNDFLAISNLLFKRHVRQGWDPAVLKAAIVSALNKLKSKLEAPLPLIADADPPSHKSHIFFHMQFHPGDIPRREVRQAYSDTCEEVLRDECEIEQFTIAYSKAKTIGSVIAKAQLHQAEGHEVTKFIAGELP